MQQILNGGERVVFGPTWSWIIAQAAASTAAGVGTVILFRTTISDFSRSVAPMLAMLVALGVLRLFDRPVLFVDRSPLKVTLASGWVPIFRTSIAFERSELSDVLVESTNADEGNPTRVVLLATSGTGYVLASGQELQCQMVASQVRNAIFATGQSDKDEHPT